MRDLQGGTGSAHPAGAIGPNAIIQTVRALRERLGDTEAEALLSRAGHGRLARELPRTMVQEGDVIALVQALTAQLGLDAALAVFERAGSLTGDYLLAHRIPGPARLVLSRLPTGIGLWALGAAIRKHAWTFAGSARFTYVAAERTFALSGCALCRGLTADRPVCGFYRATFEHLLQALVGPAIRVQESACQAVGADACRFTIHAPLHLSFTKSSS